MYCLLPALFMAGCISLAGSKSVASPRLDRDHYVLIEQNASSTFGCHYDYRVYEPRLPRTSTSIILGHGFLRDQDNMIELSRTLANAGIRVVTLDFCNMHAWNGHHERNAQDMRNLAASLRLADDIIYAGFSAGALAAILAADNNTRAIVALDLVDQANLGSQAIVNLDTPLVGLAGPASGCNARNNGDSVYRSRAESSLSQVFKIDSASHCEFESPSNWLCEAACGDGDDEQTASLQRGAIIQRIVNIVEPYLSSPPS